MRAPLASLVVLSLFGILSGAAPADKITYLQCRADNEDQPSLYALDDTTQKVCDRAVQDTWFSPFDARLVSWQTAGRRSRSTALEQTGATSTTS